MLPRLKTRASRDWIPTPYIPRAIELEYYGVEFKTIGLYPKPKGLGFTPRWINPIKYKNLCKDALHVIAIIFVALRK